MKNRDFILILALLAISTSCNLLGGDKHIKGQQSPMGEVGAQVYSNSIPGIQNATAVVTSVDDGVSTFSGQATITNAAIRNVISNIPEFTLNGNNVTITGLKFKVTKEGIESMVPNYPGIIVKYGSKVGDTYTGKGGIKRTVISKSEQDEYPYGFYDIKVMKVEESPSAFPGIKKLVYVANHRFGIVGIEITFDDNTTTNLTIGGSAEN